MKKHTYAFFCFLIVIFLCNISAAQEDVSVYDQYMSQGTSFGEQGKWQEAFMSFAKAHDAKNTNLSAYNAGFMLKKLNQPCDARNWFAIAKSKLFTQTDLDRDARKEAKKQLQKLPECRKVMVDVKMKGVTVFANGVPLEDSDKEGKVLLGSFPVDTQLELEIVWPKETLPKGEKGPNKTKSIEIVPLKGKNVKDGVFTITFTPPKLPETEIWNNRSKPPKKDPVKPEKSWFSQHTLSVLLGSGAIVSFGVSGYFMNEVAAANEKDDTLAQQQANGFLIDLNEARENIDNAKSAQTSWIVTAGFGTVFAASAVLVYLFVETPETETKTNTSQEKDEKGPKVIVSPYINSNSGGAFLRLDF